MEILPSIICANLLNIESDLDRLINTKIKILHFDVMDGISVKNVFLGSYFAQAVKNKYHNRFKLDVHLMSFEPYNELKNILNVGADRVAIQYAQNIDLIKCIDIIKKINPKVEFGIAFNPDVAIDAILDIINFINKEFKLTYIIIMSVFAGEYGQKFELQTFDRISTLNKKFQEQTLNIEIVIDGGINNENYKECLKCGASQFVVGKYLFSNPSDMLSKIDSFYAI